MERIAHGFIAGPFRLAWILALCLVAGSVGGALVTFATAPIALALAIGAVGGVALLRSPMLALLSVIGVVILLPFAAVPLGIGFNPTFLNLAVLATLTIWVLRVALGQQRRLVFPAVAPTILIYMLMAIFAFILGMGHAALTPSIVRHFAELLLAIVFALVLVNVLQTEERFTLAIKAIILAGAGAAFIGVFLYVLPDNLALRLLSPLRYLEYHVGLRYINDDPSLAERAIGTSVDPNSFGGLLVLVTTLTAAQLFSSRPLFPRAVTVLFVMLMGVCLVLTFSRSAMAGLVTGLSIIALLRYRRLFLWMALAGVVFLILPQTQGYISRAIAGVQGQDLATQMRFGEYSDAIRLIQRHPWFGVGFAGVPEIDIYLGVSSLYLLLAENMGLIGVTVFLLMMAVFFLHLWHAWQEMANQRIRPIVLGLGAGLAGVLVSGIFDHYFVNINFPHSVTLFWLFIGLALAATHLDEREPATTDDQPRPALRHARAPAVLLALFLPALVLGGSLLAGAGIARAENDRNIPQKAAKKPQYPAAKPQTSIAADHLRKIDPDLLKAALEKRQEPHRFLVHLESAVELDLAALKSLPELERRQTLIEQLQETAQHSQRGIRAALSKAQAEGHVSTYEPFWIFNGLSVTGDADALLEIAARPDVERIRSDRKFWLPEPDQVPGTYTANPGDGLEWGVERVRAQMAWQALGIEGAGVVVASMDTGVDWLHPDLQPAYRGYNEKDLPVHTGNWYSVTDEEYLYPGDGNGHGTHTTATMVGQNGVGVAPGAQWIAVKVFHNQGHTFESWLHDAFQWLLAPAGNPALAPDVVNGSWGNDVPTDESLRHDISLLRAAGIVPVFAIGNNGPERESLGSPASYPEVITVGAIDQAGEVASFSGRGPSPWGEIKPELVAPGTVVRSAVPGGGRQAWNGTSMATPHVSGVIALMLQADPTLGVDKIEEVLKATATPIGDPVPNNDAGWGAVDAYRAVASVMDVGFLHGRITRAVDDQPIAGAQVAVAHRDSAPFAHTTTDTQGYYELTLPPGPYEISVSAFAYEPAAVSGVRISQDARLARDVSLALRPAGVLFGQVTDEATGGPLAAQIRVLGTPVTVETSANTGRFTVPLPPGTYDLAVVSDGHRVGHASAVSIAVDETTKQDFTLPAAPTILLVDSGGWYYGGQSRFFTDALDDLDYTYDVWQIKNLDDDIPTAKDLTAYDVTIWSSPRDAPGLIGASGTITNYLEAGGRLLLTGQDVGYWDGGGSQDFFAAYYRDYVHAVYVRDDANLREGYGAAGTPFEGQTFKLGRADSARNQYYPDQIAALDDEFTQLAFYYGTPAQNPNQVPAGLMVGQCLPYRIVYLAFGFEGIESPEARSAVMAQAIQALMAPPSRLGVRVAADSAVSTSAGAKPHIQQGARQIVPAGEAAQHVVTVRNTGTRNDTFDVSLQDAEWESSLWTGDFSQPLAESVRIASCQAITVGVQVTVPAGTARHTADQVAVWAESHSTQDGSPVTDEIVLTTKTPAGILLVDDDRWINVEAQYEAALDGLGIGYDDWPIGWNVGDALGSPAPEILDLYPTAIWFTGYDWFQTLTPAQEEQLGGYLDSGGRLFLSSQDYLYTRGYDDFARDYLGVITYTEDLTSTVVTGAAGSPLGDDLGPYALDYPFPNHSDTIEPVVPADVVFRGNDGQSAAVAYDPQDQAFKSIFLAFPFEALSRPAAESVMERITDWLSPLHTSTVEFGRSVAAEGDRLTVTIRLHNDAQVPVDKAKIRAYVPLEAEYVAGSLKGAVYDPLSRVMRWETGVPAGETIEVAYRIELAAAIPDGTLLTHRVVVEDDSGVRLPRTAEVRVDAPDLSTSEKLVSDEEARLGDVLRYAIRLRNTGTHDTETISLTDDLPSQLELVEGSLSVSSGRVTSDERRMIWEGRVPQDGTVTIQYQTRVVGYGIARNVAHVDDGTGEITELETTTVVPTRLYLPLLSRPGR